MKLGFTYVTTPLFSCEHFNDCELVAGISYDRWSDVPDSYVDLGAPSSYQVEQVCSITEEEFNILLKSESFCDLLDMRKLYFIPEDEGEKETLYLIKSRANRERLLAVMHNV